MRTLWLLILLAIPSVSQKPGPQKSAQPKPAVIEVVEVKAQRDQSLLNIDGKLKNTGERVANELVILVDVLDSDKRPLTTQKGGSDPESLEPGSEGEFHAQMPLPARAVYVRLHFEESGGRYLKSTNAGPVAIE